METHSTPATCATRFPASGAPFSDGLYGLLLSPSTSLFLYSPIALASVPALVAFGRRDRHLAVLLSSLILIFVVFYAFLGNWAGGRSYGSRYLVPVLPFLALPVAVLFEPGTARRVRAAAAALAVLSVAVQIPGVLVDFSRVSQRWAAMPSHQSQLGPERRLLWSASPLLLNAQETAEAVPRNLHYLAGSETPPAVDATSRDEGRRDFGQQFWFSLDLWWLYLFYLGVYPAWVAVAVGVIQFLMIAWVARGLVAEQGTSNRAWPFR